MGSWGHRNSGAFPRQAKTGRKKVDKEAIDRVYYELSETDREIYKTNYRRVEKDFNNKLDQWRKGKEKEK